MQVSSALAHVRGLRPHQARLDYHVPTTLVVAGLVVLALLMTIRLGLDAFDIFVRDAGMSSDPSPVVVTLADTAIAVPGNMVRFASQRGGAHDKLNLFLHWPSLEGFTTARAGRFQPGEDGQIVYMTITPASGAMSPEARFHALYPRVLSDETREAPDGMLIRPFREGFGYDGEELFIAPRPEKPLIARCQSADRIGATCMVEYRTDRGLDVLYRFRRALLEEWRDLDPSIRAMVKGMVAAARPR